jgi:hypothetical protein
VFTSLIHWFPSFQLEHFLLKAKIVVVELLSAIVFFKWLFRAFLEEMKR